MTTQSTWTPEVLAERDAAARGNDFGKAGALREIIGKEAARLALALHGELLQAVVLTGSVARDEATLIEDGEKWKLLGDAEFLLIFRPKSKLPSRAVTDHLCRNIEAAISRLGISGEISVSAAHPTYLSALPPHIFAYELRTCGRVVWGNRHILARIPKFTVADIPLEDAWCLLSNRMVEQIDEFEKLEPAINRFSRTLVYKAIKLYLDMATSYLLFAGAYAPTYAERARRLRILADNQLAGDSAPFDLCQFADRVCECTWWKLSGSDLTIFANAAQASDLGFSWWSTAMEHARRLWRWELEQLTRQDGGLEIEKLLGKWNSSQSALRRIKGWLYVVRDQGWHRSWKHWPRWTRLARRAAPRYWIYEVAGDVFSQLPALINYPDGGYRAHSDWKTLGCLLPVNRTREPRENMPEWRWLARDIAWNYKRFLVETRS